MNYVERDNVGVLYFKVFLKKCKGILILTILKINKILEQEKI